MGNSPDGYFDRTIGRRALRKLEHGLAALGRRYPDDLERSTIQTIYCMVLSMPAILSLSEAAAEALTRRYVIRR